MDGKEMNQIVEFLQKRLETEKPDPDEFTAIEFMKAADVPRSTAEGQLLRAQELKLVSSRKIGRARYWKFVDQAAWQEWIESKK